MTKELPVAAEALRGHTPSPFVLHLHCTDHALTLITDDALVLRAGTSLRWQLVLHCTFGTPTKRQLSKRPPIALSPVTFCNTPALYSNCTNKYISLHRNFACTHILNSSSVICFPFPLQICAPKFNAMQHAISHSDLA